MASFQLGFWVCGRKSNLLSVAPLANSAPLQPAIRFKGTEEKADSTNALAFASELLEYDVGDAGQQDCIRAPALDILEIKAETSKLHS